MIRLGIIGTAGSCFSERYLPLLKPLFRKVQIVTVYDPVLVHASRVASIFEAELSCSFQRLIDRSDIHGLLMLSPVWSGEMPVAAAMQKNKPMYCSQEVWRSLTQKQTLETLYQETGATVVIESECRYWPSILRARELQATKLGHPCELNWHISTEAFCNPEFRNKKISMMLDGICFLLQRSHITLAEPHGTKFYFMKHRNDAGGSVPVSIHFSHPDTPSDFLIRLQCERGTIDIHSSNHLSWQLEAESERNLLEAEQAATALQVDHFCRHVSGGLIPLHNITNALWNDRQAKWLQAQLEESFRN